jgi:hypothetical protein
MKDKARFTQAILRRNSDGSLSPNVHEINAIVSIAEDTEERFPTNEKVRIPPDLERDIIARHHDDAVSGHAGIEKTLEQLRRRYTFPRMKEKVTTYIRRCNSCKLNKSERHAAYGTIQFSAPPDQPWSEITMDFITDLPESLDKASGRHYNGIMVVVDRLTKYNHYIPYRKDFTAEQTAATLIDRVFRIHGLPRKIVTDRDKLFTSNLWKTFVARIGTKHAMSTAFHPQTDGQTERSNQTLEAYLRHFVNYKQDNWLSYLPMAQLAINNQLSSTTKETPFWANHGRHPDLWQEALPSVEAQSGIDIAKQLQDAYGRMTAAITTMQKNATSRQSQFKKDPQLKEGDRVYVLTKNFGTKRPSKKLDHVKVGPFLIIQQTGPVNYRVALPSDTRKHQTFHVSQLEPADPETPLQETFHQENFEEDVFEVEKILKQKGQRYLVKWKGYPHSENTWEPLKHLSNCRLLLQEFRRSSKAGYRPASRIQ